MNDEKGIYIIGTLVGYSEKPWNNGNGINRRLGIVVNEYSDDFGQTQMETQLVDVHQDVAGIIQNRAKELTGQLVKVRVRMTARVGGKTGAFLSCFMPKDSDIVPLAKSVSKVA